MTQEEILRAVEAQRLAVQYILPISALREGILSAPKLKDALRDQERYAKMKRLSVPQLAQLLATDVAGTQLDTELDKIKL